MRIPFILMTHTRLRRAQTSAILCLALLLGTGVIATASVIDSKHNLSTSGPGPVKATSETQICVFCHTPHGGDQTSGGPLWNRVQSTATYTPYLSNSMDANAPPGTPGASSKLCLSCHDGTISIGVVGNLNGKTTQIDLSGTTNSFMPSGLGTSTGETRNIGIDLSNDHPISFTYDTTLSSSDGELRPPPVTYGTTVVVDNRKFGVNPMYPLESSQMQCPTCHDPHLSTNVAPKFLRGLRLQATAPLGGLYTPVSDIMCLACHDKDKSVSTWSNSAHANVNIANEAYTDAAAAMFDFPLSTPVWQASCLGCHDTHTVQGARRLLREGTNSISIPKSGGNSAIEETCYQCHSAQGTSILKQSIPAGMVSDIKSDFALNIHMPIAIQPEVHNIGGSYDNDSSSGTGGLATGTTGRCNTSGDKCGKDFMESEALLGRALAGGALANRHAECTDCHNPHRSTKNRLFNANAATPDAAGTHKHNIAVGDTAPHNNLASGSMRGSFGVEPVYFAANFGTLGIPTGFTVKRGDPGLSTLTDVGQAYVTREYQVCLKCHSNYAYNDNTPPNMGYMGGTLQYTNGFDTYLNTAMELQAPATHKGAPASTSDSGAYAPTYSANNYRSWHPVMNNTGRTTALRGMTNPNLWRSPWNGSDLDGGTTVVAAVGNQTMYCSDCHGTVNNIANGVVPDGNGSPGAWTEDGKPWGPHGSAANFILKGSSDVTSPTTVTSDLLCFRCHAAAQYADSSSTPPASTLPSGFGYPALDAYGFSESNLHQRHAFYTSVSSGAYVTSSGVVYNSSGVPSVWPASAVGTYRCTFCHTGTAHGWKNKGFLDNLNDIGPEVNRAINGTIGGALGGEVTPASAVLIAGQDVPSGTRVPQTPTNMAPVPTGYSNGPYYQGTLLYVNKFKASGQWTKSDCANSGCH